MSRVYRPSHLLVPSRRPAISRLLVFAVFLSLFATPGWGASSAMPGQDHDNPLGVAYDCLAALAKRSKGADNMLERAKSDGNELLRLLSTDATKRTGWPYVQKSTAKTEKCGQPGSLDAFGDGTCNPPETPYMIETGYSVACLAQLSMVTGDEKYLKVAKKAVADSWNLGITPAGCKDCFFYWYSYHPNDLNRYVRNTNVIMGLGNAWLYAATGDTSYRDRALAVARAEHREIKAGNFGYFGIDDPKYRTNPKAESQRIENHIPHQVKALKDMGKLLNDRQATADAKIMLDAFLDCRNDRCKPNNCSAWAAPLSCKATATIAPCVLADQDKNYKARCDAVVDALPRLNAFQIFLLESPSEAGKLKLK